MILSCGIDIEEIDRFEKHCFKKGILSDLIYDIFTPREIDNYSYHGKKAFLKGFCFKEAFYKAINSQNISWFDIEIYFSDNEYQIKKSEILLNELMRKSINRIDVQFNETDKYVTAKVFLIN